MYRGTAADGGQQRYRAEFTGIPGVRDSTRASTEQARPPNMFKSCNFLRQETVTERTELKTDTTDCKLHDNHTVTAIFLSRHVVVGFSECQSPHSRNGSFCGRLWKQDKLTAAKRIEPGELILFFPSAISFSEKPIWPSGPARGCYSLGRRFESVCRPSHV